MIVLSVVVTLIAGLTGAPGTELWTVALSRPLSAGNLGTAGSPHTTLAVYPAHALRGPVDTFTAELAGSGEVDVRGPALGGGWTEWTPTPAVLPGRVRTVQVRLVYDGQRPAGLTVRATTTRAAARPAAAAGAARYDLFATREGLVGGRTASGHVITERDHFVALPSRRGLSTKDSGEYTAVVCAPNGRCEWAPVADVGPWNTRDDYWNPPGVRQMWPDLSQGRPEAQAARLDGYNGGRDQFGRPVRNPAGIDLADGTFWDGLRLTGNSWVTVTFSWTGGMPAGRTGVVQAGLLNVRYAPTARSPAVGLAAHHAQLRVDCRQAGDPVTGSQGRTDHWYRLAPQRFVSAAHVSGVTSAPPC